MDRVSRRIWAQKLTPEGLPKHLYKYRALRSASDLARVIRIMDGHIFAAHRSSFNDPFDCAPIPKLGKSTDPRDEIRHLVYEENVGLNRKALKKLLKSAEKSLKNVDLKGLFGSVLADLYDRTGVVSLSATPSDLLMWGHYASEHSGVCIRLNRESSASRIHYAYPVLYSEERPTVNYPVGDGAELVEAAFLVKSQCWEYEKEWRALYFDGPGEKAFPVACADGLIFGAKTPQEYKDIIYEYVHGATNDQKIALFKADLDPNKYALNLAPLPP